MFLIDFFYMIAILSLPKGPETACFDPAGDLFLKALKGIKHLQPKKKTKKVNFSGCIPSRKCRIYNKYIIFFILSYQIINNKKNRNEQGQKKNARINVMTMPLIQKGPYTCTASGRSIFTFS